MASDNLNQVGKYIGKTQKDADYALKKIKPGRPAVERTRDMFDPDNDFEMTFMVGKTQKRVSLSLQFNKPPPMFDCNCAYCEGFSDNPPGNAEVNLANHADPSSVSVYVNDVTWPKSGWEILSGFGTDPTPARIAVYGMTDTLNEIVVCYADPMCLADNYLDVIWGEIQEPSAQNYPYFAGGFTGDNPALAAPYRPKIGPVSYMFDGGRYWGLRAEADMVVRIRFDMGLNYVSDAYSRSYVQLFRNGDVIGMQIQEFFFPSWGTYIGGPDFDIDLRNIQLRAGDVIWARGEITNGNLMGGFGGPFVVMGQQHLQIFRGTVYGGLVGP